MRLRNRLIKADFWRDTDLIRSLPIAGRMFYEGLWQLAEDSGCLLNDVWAFKLHLFPLDEEASIETITQWRDTLIELGKLVPYQAEGKECLFLKNFHKHQSLRSPGKPESTPLPDWVHWEEPIKERASGSYLVTEPYGDDTVTVEEPYEELTEKVAEPYDQQNELEVEYELELKEPTSGDAEIVPIGISRAERQIMSIWRSIERYPFDWEKDTEHLRLLMTDFPTLDLLAESERWRTYKLDKPLKQNSNARLQFRNWCEMAIKPGNSKSRGDPSRNGRQYPPSRNNGKEIDHDRDADLVIR